MLCKAVRPISFLYGTSLVFFIHLSDQEVEIVGVRVVGATPVNILLVHCLQGDVVEAPCEEVVSMFVVVGSAHVRGRLRQCVVGVDAQGPQCAFVVV